jgi:hypothetical protein
VLTNKINHQREVKIQTNQDMGMDMESSVEEQGVTLDFTFS